jgi:hypothetical protein
MLFFLYWLPSVTTAASPPVQTGSVAPGRTPGSTIRYTHVVVAKGRAFATQSRACQATIQLQGRLSQSVQNPVALPT